MHRRSLGAAVCGAALLAILVAGITSAHVVKSFGPYSIALGWLHEPAYVGVDNAVQVIIKDGSGSPVDDVPASDLGVTLTAGGQTSAVLPLNASHDPDTGLGTPGEYTAHVIPTIPGDYTFHLNGTVHGTAVDETVTSSDTTFDTVQDQTTAQFPAKIPSTTDLASKVDRQDARITAAQAAASGRLGRCTRALVVGAALGGIGVVLGAATAVVLALRARAGPPDRCPTRAEPRSPSCSPSPRWSRGARACRRMHCWPPPIRPQTRSSQRPRPRSR